MASDVITRYAVTRPAGTLSAVPGCPNAITAPLSDMTSMTQTNTIPLLRCSFSPLTE